MYSIFVSFCVGNGRVFLLLRLVRRRGKSTVDFGADRGIGRDHKASERATGLKLKDPVVPRGPSASTFFCGAGVVVT